MENLEFVATVLNRYALPPALEAEFVPGGLLHRLMRVQTEAGSWALKILSRRSVASAQGRERFERAEILAQRAQAAGIPALAAQPGPDGQFLQQVGDEIVLLYPWFEGHTLPPQAVSHAVAAQMGEYLGRIHALEIRFPDQQPPVPEAFEAGHWERLVECGAAARTVWASDLRAALPQLVAANDKAMHAQLALRAGWVTGHLDYDQKNVLWSAKGAPMILDWEAAKPIHPALEAMGAGLSWAGQSAGASDEGAFKAFLTGYTGVNPLSQRDLDIACDAVLGKWLIWLEFNLQRSLEPHIGGTPEERITHDALFHALGATLKLQADSALYREWVRSRSKV